MPPGSYTCAQHFKCFAYFHHQWHMSILCATNQYQYLVQTHTDTDIANICTDTDIIGIGTALLYVYSQ